MGCTKVYRCPDSQFLFRTVWLYHLEGQEYSQRFPMSCPGPRPEIPGSSMNSGPVQITVLQVHGYLFIQHSTHPGRPSTLLSQEARVLGTGIALQYTHAHCIRIQPAPGTGVRPGTSRTTPLKIVMDKEEPRPRAER